GWVSAANRNVRFGSKADMTPFNCDVRFTPKADKHGRGRKFAESQYLAGTGKSLARHITSIELLHPV
ncbi:MAG: hypothetical protein WB489_10575, partial [Pseudolabrys sp.]